MSTSIVLTGQDLSPEQVARIAYDASIEVGLSNEAKQGIQASRDVIEAILKDGRIVYGVNTGFGALSSHTISPDDIETLQANLVRSHAAGTGDELDEPTVRAMMLLRANTLAKGFSGIRLEVVELLMAMLNKGVYPCIPSQGSLGASGDLAPLAHMALVLMDEGEAVFDGIRMSGAEALEKASLKPVTLKAKEGLALLNGTQMMTAIGALTLIDAERILNDANVAAGLTIEAVMGSHKPFDDRVAQARPHQGHKEVALFLRNILRGSGIAEAHLNCAKVQDAYSLRCIPQVHGTVADTLRHVRDVLTIEMNAATDNPLVFPNGDVISQGNFHGEPVAVALDMLGIAMAELASIAERRLDKLMNPVFSDLPAFLADSKEEAGLQSGFMIAHYAAASLVSENKVLSHPASVDSIPTSNDKEDHVSMGSIAARKAKTIVGHTRWVVATELLAGTQGLRFRQNENLKAGHGVQAVYDLITNTVKPGSGDRVLKGEVEKMADLMDNGSIQKAVAPFITA